MSASYKPDATRRQSNKAHAINAHMRSLVYLTSLAPCQIADELRLAGYTVFEALEISEVWYLCEHEDIDVVVIAPEVEDQDQIELQLRRPTIRLKPGSTAKDISWELWNLFPNTQQLIQ